MINYVGLAIFVLYFMVLRMMAGGKIEPVSGALVVVVGGFVIAAVPRAIILGSVSAAVGWIDIVTMLAQLVLALVVFRKLQDYEESLTAWIVLGLAGAYLILVAAPSLVRFLLIQL